MGINWVEIKSVLMRKKNEEKMEQALSKQMSVRPLLEIVRRLEELKHLILEKSKIEDRDSTEAIKNYSIAIETLKWVLSGNHEKN